MKILGSLLQAKLVSLQYCAVLKFIVSDCAGLVTSRLLLLDYIKDSRHEFIFKVMMLIRFTH